jgi:hypothetical protein
MDDTDPHEHERLLEGRQELTDALVSLPYDLVTYLQRSVVHSELGYPELAAGDAYRALLLTDEVANEGFEYHEKAVEALLRHVGTIIPDVLDHGLLSEKWADDLQRDLDNSVDGKAAINRLAIMASVRAFQMLALNLLLCGCLRSSATFCTRGLEIAPNNQELLHCKEHIETLARRKLKRTDWSISDLPDHGLARREVYPWNKHEPDRFAPECLDSINATLAHMAPKCEARVAELPVLLEGESETDGYDIIPTCKQLGVFAKTDIAPGEVVLDEYSLLTANNRLKDPVCDACSCELPALGSQKEPVSCSECYDTVFCSQFCHDEAQAHYHPAVCEKDIDAIAKDPDAREADETLYLLLLARAFAMAAHQEVHPLEVSQVKFIWGDFVASRSNDIDPSPNAGPPPEWTLPFSFKYNIEAPLHVLEKMDIDMYATLAKYDLWISNTLYAKFRGTASARKSLRDGRPDVAAVHPYWCLANHDCDPNVTWEWGGQMVLKARKERINHRPGGIKADEEILNHYCDIDLPVQQRREWARGSLGGWCMCQRCRIEASSAALLSNGQPA